jgi:ferredoxin-NADP reductase
MNPVPFRKTSPLYRAEMLNRRWLSKTAFEAKLTKPASFTFTPGQRIRFVHEEIDREYTLVSTPLDDTISLCIRLVEGGRFSSALAIAKKGEVFSFTGPHGYFTFIPSPRKAVFVATGTGIAPFVSMSRSGVQGFVLLHGVPDTVDLYYKELFRSMECEYTPCLSRALEGDKLFRGRVTEYLARLMPRMPYDFYLCGRGDMVRDVTLIADEKFSGSRVYMETFY